MTSVLQDRQGPDWPLGLIAVASAGTPVAIMSLVDAARSNAGETEDPPIPNSATRPSNEYSVNCTQIIVQGLKAGSGAVLADNTGNVYLIRKGAAGASDTGAIVLCIKPGQTQVFAVGPGSSSLLSPYRYYLDADNSGDSALVTLVM